MQSHVSNSNDRLFACRFFFPTCSPLLSRCTRYSWMHSWMHSAEPRSAYADIHNVVCSYQMAERRRKGGGKEKESRSNEGPAAPRLWASSRVFAPRLAPTAAHRFLSGAPHALHGSPHLLFTSVDVPPSPPPSFLFLLLFLFRSLRCSVRSLARSLSLSIRAGVNTLVMLRLQNIDAEYFR